MAWAFSGANNSNATVDSTGGSDLSFTGPFSIGFWLRPDSLTTDKFFAALSAAIIVGPGGALGLPGDNAGQLAFAINDGVNNHFAFSDAVTEGEWVAVRIERDADNYVTVYVDGEAYPAHGAFSDTPIQAAFTLVMEDNLSLGGYAAIEQCKASAWGAFYADDAPLGGEAAAGFDAFIPYEGGTIYFDMAEGSTTSVSGASNTLTRNNGTGVADPSGGGGGDVQDVIDAYAPFATWLNKSQSASELREAQAEFEEQLPDAADFDAAVDLALAFCEFLDLHFESTAMHREVGQQFADAVDAL